MLFFIIVLVVVIVVGILQAMSNSEKIEEKGKKNYQTLKSLPDFNVTKVIEGVNNEYLFAVDEKVKKIAVIQSLHKTIIPFDQIISVEVIEDNVIIQQKSSLRTIGGAVVGGVLAGGAGAVVGGLSGDSTQNKTVSKVQVKIKLRDINHPSYIINCFDCKTMTAGQKPIKPSSMEGDLYKQGLKHAHSIADTISAIIDITDKSTNNSPEKPEAPKQVGSIADELAKLADLKDRGILTEEEFNAQKQTLLHSTSTTSKNADEVKPSQNEIIVEDVVSQEVREALNNNQKILAVKLYMDNTGCSLSEATKFIDSIS